MIRIMTTIMTTISMAVTMTGTMTMTGTITTMTMTSMTTMTMMTRTGTKATRTVATKKNYNTSSNSKMVPAEKNPQIINNQPTIWWWQSGIMVEEMQQVDFCRSGMKQQQQVHSCAMG